MGKLKKLTNFYLNELVHGKVAVFLQKYGKIYGNFWKSAIFGSCGVHSLSHTELCFFGLYYDLLTFMKTNYFHCRHQVHPRQNNGSAYFIFFPQGALPLGRHTWYVENLPIYNPKTRFRKGWIWDGIKILKPLILRIEFVL